ncbi:MAG: hotdog fold thioesterase [Bacteroidota bacterium]|nr:hotdog fold thioesterase [Bacteroidota bacterium]MDX5427297.1 hotdog fold thioesterase [Bacteroidota bacterium]MDX5505249.1 hotdog fold thioesterase [Bacteroidota bacterium]
METDQHSKRIVQYMYENDAFSKWLGIEVLEVRPGFCRLQMTVRDEMTNGFGIAHGGITYSLADSALAFASNGHGVQSVSIETSISHTSPVRSGMKLVALAEEKNLTRGTGLYYISITDEEGNILALFKGTVYRTGKEWKFQDSWNEKT